MPLPRLTLLTALAMIAFAGNSLLCRAALRESGMEPAAFTEVRLASGAVTLLLLARMRRGTSPGGGNWLSALALFAYAAGFALAYRDLTAATGALLLFGAVQGTMIAYGLRAGERLRGLRLLGFALALGGLILLLLPGLAAPPLGGSLLMLGAGVAWGLYSLRGRAAGDPLRVTAGNFLRAAPLAAAWWLVARPGAGAAPPLLSAGTAYALASGALASGVGYALWYAALPALKATQAATVQLSVPLLAAFGGVAFLDEALTPRLLASAALILGGIALVLRERRPART